jgi:hypothetical protein
MRVSGHGCPAGSSRAGGGGCRDDVVAIQVIPPHEVDELRAIGRIRGIDAGERGREGVRILAVGHGPCVITTCCKEAAVIVDALGDIVVNAK